MTTTAPKKLPSGLRWVSVHERFTTTPYTRAYLGSCVKLGATGYTDTSRYHGHAEGFGGDLRSSVTVFPTMEEAQSEAERIGAQMLLSACMDLDLSDLAAAGTKEQLQALTAAFEAELASRRRRK